MKHFLMGTVVLSCLAWVWPVAATPGRCTMTGYGGFACEVAVDGGGLSFLLPDGQTFAFTLTQESQGLGFLLPVNAAPGQPPQQLREFRAVDDRPGCWARNEIYGALEFCVQVEE